jgi:hypothetical protein
LFIKKPFWLTIIGFQIRSKKNVEEKLRYRSSQVLGRNDFRGPDDGQRSSDGIAPSK